MTSSSVKKDPLMKTARIYEDFGNLARAAYYYARAGQFGKSARLYEKIENYDKAGDAYFRNGSLWMAIKMFNLAGRKDARVAQIYEQLGEHKYAADIWKSMGKTRRAKQCLTKARQLSLFDFSDKISG
jgi:tetratricopeptide (TPR) repeat protein